MPRPACASAIAPTRRSRARGVGITTDPAVRVAVFALLYDQDLNTPISVFATDAAGNTASAPLDFRAFPKVFRRSRIEVADAFLQRVVPAILENTPDFAKEVADPNDLVAAFLKINGELRRKNAETIAAYAKQTAPRAALGRHLPAAGQLAGRGGLRRPPHLLSRRQGDRSAGAPRLRSRRDQRGAGGRGEQRQGRSRRLPRHLRQLRDHRPRARRPVALRTPVVDGRPARHDRCTRASRSAEAA